MAAWKPYRFRLRAGPSLLLSQATQCLGHRIQVLLANVQSQSAQVSAGACPGSRHPLSIFSRPDQFKTSRPSRGEAGLSPSGAWLWPLCPEGMADQACEDKSRGLHAPGA